ncbi:hypothetical protein CI610_01052 [invertebrate metagenome]|uniref:Uncharacterized protein n=1 Tax=invertebrate metagenome TaxID=1711999 RepID=A0A2H9T9T4_9ZZZZ
MRKINNNGKGVITYCFLFVIHYLIPTVCISNDAPSSKPQFNQQSHKSEKRSIEKKEMNYSSELTCSFTDSNNETTVQNQDWLYSLWGSPSKDHLYLGMWTFHFESLERSDNYTANNELFGVSYKGIYGGSFRNSHGDRTYTLGLQRTFSDSQYKNLDIELGYRVGMMYGYKQSLRLFDTPFFPLVQIITDISYKNVGMEFSWAGIIITAGFFYKF